MRIALQVCAADDAGVMIETDHGGLRPIAIECVAEQVERAYALSGRSPQGHPKWL